MVLYLTEIQFCCETLHYWQNQYFVLHVFSNLVLEEVSRFMRKEYSRKEETGACSSN